jgi:hypothetical protein
MKTNVDNCPKCGSCNIKKSYYYSSIYGHLDDTPKDFCLNCGFKSKEPFSIINFREFRENKINNIINK